MYNMFFYSIEIDSFRTFNVFVDLSSSLIAKLGAFFYLTCISHLFLHLKQQYELLLLDYLNIHMNYCLSNVCCKAATQTVYHIAVLSSIHL